MIKKILKTIKLPKLSFVRNFFEKLKKKKKNNEISNNTVSIFLKSKKVFWLLILVIFISSFFGFLAGLIAKGLFTPYIQDYFSIRKITEEGIIQQESVYLPQTSQEEAIIRVVREVSPAVVSIIVTKDLPVFEQYYYSPFEELRDFFGDQFFEFRVPGYRQRGTEEREIGGGTGFIISRNGMILTNAHVVSDKEADYTVLTNDGRKLSATVLARDTIRDLAVLKVENQKNLPIIKLGNSDNLQIGQTVISIGNALGEFRNTVSSGVISGLGRTITASGGGLVKTLEDVIQTDAAINQGNSGGPLLNLKGEVIGINFAMARAAENIGFAIPVNKAKKAIEQVEEFGKIIYPFLGVRYVLIDETIQERNNLPVNYGAWIMRGERGDFAVFPDSAAEKAGLKEGDIILEFNKEKITTENSLAKIIMRHNPGDKITLKILRTGQEKIIELILGERSE